MWRRINRHEQARIQRQQPTPTERYAWGLLRARRLLGLKFRRQHPIGPFVVDFACLQHKLVIELDGEHHQSPQHAAHDAHRDALIAGQGFTVIRIKNRDVSPELLERLVREACPALNATQHPDSPRVPPLP